MSAPTDIRNGRDAADIHHLGAVADPIPTIADQAMGVTHVDAVGDGDLTPPAPVNGFATPMAPAPVLADPLLALAADVLDDLERVRIANENRLRQMTRTEEDSDSTEEDPRARGFGLSLDDPDVARLAALVDMLKAAEEQAIGNLQYRMKRHALGPWVKQTKGVGEKQAARLLAAVGDPYWNDLHDRPRLVSELWSYCGYGDATRQVRQRGVKANWSDDAKKRAWLVANSCIKSNGPYREVYDDARERYADAVHAADCKRCGPSGKPAKAGSPLSLGHQHMRGLRAISKAVLRDLWREAKRLHEHPDDQCPCDTQSGFIVGALRNPTKKRGNGPAAPMSDEQERAVCLVCGDDRGLRKDGTVRAHPYAGYSDGRKCPGSLLQPRWE